MNITCGDIVEVYTVVRFRAVQLLGDQGKEETAIAAYSVTGGISSELLVGVLQGGSDARTPPPSK